MTSQLRLRRVLILMTEEKFFRDLCHWASEDLELLNSILYGEIPLLFPWVAEGTPSISQKLESYRAVCAMACVALEKLNDQSSPWVELEPLM